MDEEGAGCKQCCTIVLGSLCTNHNILRVYSVINSLAQSSAMLSVNIELALDGLDRDICIEMRSDICEPISILISFTDKRTEH